MIRETLKYGFLGVLSIAAVGFAGVSGVAGQTLDFGAVLTGYTTPEGGNLDEADPRVIDLIEASNTVVQPSQETLDAVAAGGPAAEAAIQEYLSSGNPSPEQVSRRAVALSRAIALDPRLAENDEALFDRSLLIADYVSRALCAPRLLRLDIDPDYIPPLGTLAYDLGGAGTPEAQGFVVSTPWQNELAFAESLDMVREGALLRDLIAGVERIDLEVPNGEYRVILTTSADLVGQAPFGTVLTVNGESYLVGRSSEQEWWDRGRLRVPNGGTGVATVPEIAGTGGAIVVTTQVTNGKLSLGFNSGSSQTGGAVSGILIEPASAPSSLVLENLAQNLDFNYEDCLDLELLTQTAMAQVLLNPALGPLGEPITRGDGLTEVDGPFDDELPGSPS
ncbi:MAG: hypothetical protein WD489_04600 [Rhodovibrionaceae bacterium]